MAVAERIDPLAHRLGLVALEQIGDAGELKGRSANRAFADDEAVGERAELHLDGRDQHADHGAAEHLGHEIDFICRTNDTDGIGRIGGDEDNVRVRRLCGADDR